MDRYKITDSELDSGVVAEPNILEGTPQNNKSVFDRLPRLIAGRLNSFIDEIVGQFADRYTKEEVNEQINARITEIGSADMTKAEYDTNNTGVVDDAERLGGQLPEYYARASHETDTNNPHKVTKEQLDLGNVTNTKQMPIAGGTFTGMVTLKADPTNKLHAATKQYVDNKTGRIKVWENTAQTSNFKGKTLSPTGFKRSDYSYYIAEFRFSTSEAGRAELEVLPNGVSHRVHMLGALITEGVKPFFLTRAVTLTADNTIVISDATKKDTDGTHVETDNSYVIPVNIWGIKL